MLRGRDDNARCYISDTFNNLISQVRSVSTDFAKCLVIAVIIGCLGTFGGYAGDLAVAYSGEQLICHFNNTSGLHVNGLRLTFLTPEAPVYYVGIGADMELSFFTETEILFVGDVVPNGTWEITWPSVDLPISRAQWLVDGEVVQEIDIRNPTARMVHINSPGDLDVQYYAVGSYDPDGAPLSSYVWEWNDGVIAEGFHVQRTFSAPGMYQVTLTVINETGLASSVTSSISVLPTAPAIDTNLIFNGGFEDGLSGWLQSSGTAIYSADSAVAYAGALSAIGIEINAGSLGRLYQIMDSRVQPGHEYILSGWMKRSATTGATVIGLDYVNEFGWCPAGGYVREIGFFDGGGTDEWQYFNSGSFALPVMPADCTELWVLVDFNASEGTVWCDDLVLERVDP